MMLLLLLLVSLADSAWSWSSCPYADQMNPVDSFGYSSASVSGQGSADARWANISWRGAGPNSGIWHADVPVSLYSLNYTGYPSYGNRLECTSGACNIYRYLPTASIRGNNTEFWLSFLFKTGSQSTGGANQFRTNPSTSSNLVVGCQSGFWKLAVNGNVVSTAVSCTAQSTNLLVVQLDFVHAVTNLWVNPVLPLGNASSLATVSQVCNFNEVGFFLDTNSATDELRLGCCLNSIMGNGTASCSSNDAGTRFIDSVMSFAATSGGFSSLGTEKFGSSVALSSDLNNDAIPDLLVGAPGINSVRVLYLDVGGTVKAADSINATAGIASTAGFGSSLSLGGDVNGDGFSDLAIGAPNDDDGTGVTRGAVYIYYLSSPLPSQVSHTKIDTSSLLSDMQGGTATGFGTSIALGTGAANGLAGDINKDGNVDLAVACSFSANSVFVIFLGPNAVVKSHTKLTSSSIPTVLSAPLQSVAFVGGDMNGDNIGDLAIGVPTESGSSGGVYIAFMNTDGTAKSYNGIWNTLKQGDKFGSSLWMNSDLDGDGVIDMIVAAPGDKGQAGSSSRGAVHILFLTAATLGQLGVKNHLKVDDREGGLWDPSQIQLLDLDSFGCTVSSGWDLNGDNTAEIAVATSTGNVHLLMSNYLVDLNECSAVVGAGGWNSNSKGTNTYCNPSTSDCVNLLGGYQCSCRSGYLGSSDAAISAAGCVDINECNDGGGHHNCNGAAVCSNTQGSFTCSCTTGYTGNGVTCSNTNECTLNIHNCSPTNSECQDTVGSFFCLCNSGYVGDGLSCTNINECALGTHTCNKLHSSAACSDTAGSFLCACNSGWTGSGVGSNGCTDIDECGSNLHNCDANSACINTAASFACACNSGYVTVSGSNCTDINECALASTDPNLHNCHPAATCSNVPAGSFSCSCNSGYTGNGLFCWDINECAAPVCSMGRSTCVNLDGSYSCSCNVGFTGNGTLCSDIDECSLGTHNCSAAAVCSNTLGSYSCSCNVGYSGFLGKICVDIDECNSGVSSCVNSTCTNTAGSFQCTCHAGYSGDGTVCSDVNECATLNGGCATCSNTVGSFDCVINECAVSNGGCSMPNAICTDTPGSFACHCPPGYFGDGITDCSVASDQLLIITVQNPNSWGISATNLSAMDPTSPISLIDLGQNTQQDGSSSVLTAPDWVAACIDWHSRMLFLQSMGLMFIISEQGSQQWTVAHSVSWNTQALVALECDNGLTIAASTTTRTARMWGVDSTSTGTRLLQMATPDPTLAIGGLSGWWMLPQSSWNITEQYSELGLNVVPGVTAIDRMHNKLCLLQYQKNVLVMIDLTTFTRTLVPMVGIAPSAPPTCILSPAMVTASPSPLLLLSKQLAFLMEISGQTVPILQGYDFSSVGGCSWGGDRWVYVSQKGHSIWTYDLTQINGNFSSISTNHAILKMIFFPGYNKL